MEPNLFTPQRTKSANLGGSRPTQDHHPAFESPQELMVDQPDKGSSKKPMAEQSSSDVPVPIKLIANQQFPVIKLLIVF